MSTHREDSPNHTASEQPTEVEIKKISVNATYHTVAKADSSKKKKADNENQEQGDIFYLCCYSTQLSLVPVLDFGIQVNNP